MSNKPPPLNALDYNNIPPLRRQWYPLSVAASVYPAGGIILIILAWITPHFKMVFHDFKTELPLSTQVLLALSSAATNEFLWIPVAVVIVVIPLFIGALRRGEPMTRRSARWVRLLTLIPTLLFIVWAVVSLYLPLLGLLETVNGKHP